MATIALTNFTPNAGLADVAGTAAGSTNSVSALGVPSEEIILRVVTANATTNLTIKAGAYPPAIAAPLGDLVVSCPVGTTWIAPLASSRFTQADGSISVNSATAANHTITAFRLPRTA